MTNQSESNKQSKVDYEGIGQIAKDYAAAAGKNLDYSPESIAILEEILQNHYEEAMVDQITDGYLWNISVIYGVYLGETLLRNAISELGYHWVLDDENVPSLVKDEKNTMSPVTKTYKRLKNGPEDNVQSFYDIAILIAQGKFPSA